MASVDRAQLISTLIRGFLPRWFGSAPGVPSDTVIGRGPEFLEPRDGQERRTPALPSDACSTPCSPPRSLVCPGCGRRGDPVCGRCAARLHAAPPAAAPSGLDGWWPAFAYEGVAREVVARVKYRGARAAVPWLADAMVAAMLDGLDPTSRSTSSRGHPPAAPAGHARLRPGGAPGAGRRPSARAPRRVRCLGLLDRRPGPPQTGLTGADRRRRAGLRRTARRAAVGARGRRRRHHRRHVVRGGARPAGAGAHRVVAVTAAGRHHPGHWHPGHVAPARRRLARTVVATEEVQMDIVVRGKNRPVSSRLDAVAREKVVAHRQVHARRRARRGRLRRAAASPRRPSRSCARSPCTSRSTS